MRLAAYAGASVALATGVVLKALHQRPNFYSACVYLSQSSANLMILTNLCLLVTGFMLFWLQRLLYGPLRPIETEQLYERGWFAVTETCLAMTIFRGEMGGWFLVMFICLLVGKIWGWISEGRVEYLEQQPPSNPRLFHTRLAISLILQILFNSSMLEYCIETVLERARPDMMVMFGFEFAVLTILSSSTAARYAISLTEIYVTRQQLKEKIEERRQEIRTERGEILRAHAQSGRSGFPTGLPDENDINEMELDVPGWEEKGRWVFYLDLLTDFLKLNVYLAFFAILFAFYGLPIHILRDVVVTIRSFGKRIMDFLRYRNATRDMNERYPDATAQDVGGEDVCIICREQMTPLEQPAGENGAVPVRTRVPERLRPKKLPCGHILHFSCLRSWLERQQNCPTCRRPVVVPPRNRVFPGQGANNARGFGGGVAGNQPAGQNGGAPEGMPRARFYQLGPFRIGFGAGRADMFQNLQQQVHQGNIPVQQPGNVNAPGPQHIGFGFGFGRPPPAAQAAQAAPAAPAPTVPATQVAPAGTHSMSNVQDQLQQIEQQITQEMNSLQVSAEQLHLVRLLQAELQRLRNPHANFSQQINATGGSHPGLFTAPPSSSLHMRRQFIADPRAPALGAGDTRLPEGISIPQGWTLLPLHSAEVGTAGAGTSSNPIAPEVSTSTPSAQPFPSSTNQEENAQGEHDREGSSSARDPQKLFTSGESIRQTEGRRTESPSQGWTSPAYEGASERPDEQSTAPTVNNEERPSQGEGSQREISVSEQGDSSGSASKGKERAARVEDVADDDES